MKRELSEEVTVEESPVVQTERTKRTCSSKTTGGTFSKVPEFISDVSSFRVVFPNLNYQPGTADGQSEAVPKGEVPESSSVGQTSVMRTSVELSPREEEILSLMRDMPMFSIRKLAEQQNLSVKEVWTVVSSLRKKGIIEHIGANNGGFWKIR